MEDLKKYKEIIIFGSIILLGSFCWFQLRPVLIKKECSQIKYMKAGKPAVPASLGITQEEADRQNTELKKQVIVDRIKNGCTGNESGLKKLVCDSTPAEVIPVPPTQAIPAEPDYETTREATKDEYDLCLRRNGL